MCTSEISVISQISPGKEKVAKIPVFFILKFKNVISNVTYTFDHFQVIS